MDNICFQTLGQDVLNFTSPAAYKVFISCKDNHKAWESFEVFLHGTMLELIQKYVNETHEEPSPEGFLIWQSNVTSATLKLLLQIVLTYGLGIYVQRVGDRNNDNNVSEAGRFAFIDWFYGFKHPIYREIEYRDLMTKSIYPEEVKSQFEKNLSFSTKNSECTNQGGDFLLEQKVQRQKLVAPKGIVERSVWQRISRSIDKLDEIYSNASKYLSLTSDTQPRVVLLGDEILEWRAVLRHSEYLDVERTDVAYSMTGDILSNDMINLPSKLRQKRLGYWQMATNTPLENISYQNLNVLNNVGIENNFEQIEQHNLA